MIVKLVSLSLEDGGGVVLPMGLHTQPLPLDQWSEFKENLVGLSARNLPQVQKQLSQMGLIAASPLNVAAMTMVGPPTAQSAGIPGLGSGGLHGLWNSINTVCRAIINSC